MTGGALSSSPISPSVISVCMWVEHLSCYLDPATFHSAAANVSKPQMISELGERAHLTAVQEVIAGLASPDGHLETWWWRWENGKRGSGGGSYFPGFILAIPHTRMWNERVKSCKLSC